MSNKQFAELMFILRIIAFIALLIFVVVISGCAHPTRWVPCPDSVTIDGHVTHGKYDGSGPSNTGEADGYDSNYESYEFGGALHSKLGVEPEHCRTWGGEVKQ